ncbi:DNA cytosine methyltransferase [Lacrimispora sphenoides]|uniref:Cytosine-specific methyltransferase n=1 Tax=Lacrimispora sphenoides JCM 1415 TaxID=1297793 RepID=A0ABY1C296_9FIRM|nr:DNA cytosine methyltransferase [Lacrimispora sphenoides]SET56139.1 DNA (cytosine-5)-methyltransferase 1 [[Clostridium] sphenoides JCM 1415]SUY49764.1 DNA-cytosine methyltransferase [Lacrimispora sphenoides]
MKDKHTIRTLSLFSGAGGLDIGFHKAGYDIVGCVEIEKQYCDTLIANRNMKRYFNPNAKIYCQDIRQFDANEFVNMGIECVIGGPPCQPFSAAGRRAGGVPGMQDERGMLFESYCNVLRILKPKVFVFENVYGLKGANNGEAWNEIVASFSEIGYIIEAEILDAADYGVPQHRERLILVGRLDGDYSFPEPTNGPDSSSGKQLVSIFDAIKDLKDEASGSEDLGGMYGHLLPLIPEGLNYSFFTKEMGYPEPYFAWRSKFHDFLYKADRNKPSRTLKAQPGKFTGPFHWDNRHFSIHELKRIQSFPDDYELTGTNTQVIAQIGNSVPPKLAEVIAVSVREQLLRPTDNLTYKTRDVGFKSTFRKRQRETSNYYKQVAENEIIKRFGSINADKIIGAYFGFDNSYYIGYISKFSKETLKKKPSIKQTEKYQSVYKIQSKCQNENIDIDMTMCNGKNLLKGTICIRGLRKYLLKVDTLQLTFKIGDICNIFDVWDVIQKELVDMSQFYSLIDIYGHYANRGDTVKVSTLFQEIPDNETLIKEINFFGDSDNCGLYISRADVSEKMGLSIEDIDKFVEKMRNLRFDVRTAKTHPTIRTDEIICTYPFPMLSERVLFNKKSVREA